jgi:hypothetical protein
LHLRWTPRGQAPLAAFAPLDGYDVAGVYGKDAARVKYEVATTSPDGLGEHFAAYTKNDGESK